MASTQRKASIYIRMSPELKKKIEEEAWHRRESVNSYAIASLELTVEFDAEERKKK